MTQKESKGARLAHSILLAATEIRAAMEVTASDQPLDRDQVIKLAMQYGHALDITVEEIDAALDRSIWDLLFDAD